MTLEYLNIALYRRVHTEQEENYKAWFSLLPEVILNHSYKYTSREDILVSLEENEQTKAQCIGAFEISLPSRKRVQGMEKRDNSYHMDDIWDAVEDCANTFIARAKSEPER